MHGEKIEVTVEFVSNDVPDDGLEADDWADALGARIAAAVEREIGVIADSVSVTGWTTLKRERGSNV